MACIIKLPTTNSKGIVSFTTQEEVILRASKERLEELKKLKEKYIICLHYNWHNLNCKPDNLFDIHLAGEDDLKITNNAQIYQIYMDACNFVRPEYRQEAITKTWDILFIGNPVFFKDPLSFLKAIRELYDQKYYRRALYICPLPRFKWSDRKTVVYNIRQIYEKMFNQSEQLLFNHLVIRENYPRFFDRQTLATFYKNSRVFVHTAPDERRCRVASYAWAAHMPVIGKDCVGSLLPKHLRRPPFFYRVLPNENYSSQIKCALEDFEKAQTDPDWNLVETEFLSTKSVLKFQQLLNDYFTSINIKFEGTILSKNLDQRMGWHHGFGISTNTCNQNLDTFMSKISNLTEEKNHELINEEYPEENLIEYPFNSGINDFNQLSKSYKINNIKKSLILNIKSFLRQAIKVFLK